MAAFSGIPINENLSSLSLYAIALYGIIEKTFYTRRYKKCVSLLVV